MVLAVLVAVGAGAGYRWLRSPRLTPELRGHAIAQELGCFACHGPGATGGVANPGSEENEVPAWDGGNAMMYVKNEGEIREWILFGHPLREENEDSTHSHDADEHDGELIEMPAFEGLVAGRRLEDLIAYYKAVAKFGPMPEGAREGYRVARQNGCFGCHGPGGLVGTHNPGSFKRYIPPWRGRDYSELVKSDAELRGWILDGGIERLESNPIARFFIGRQIIDMPAYRDRLTDREADALVSYITWLQQR